MDFAKVSERLMRMDNAAWAKHANPWSGWTRITVLPLLCAAIWSRVWLGWGACWLVGLVLAWTWLNPRLFGPPAHYRAWMTRAVLGERVWLNRHQAAIPAHHQRTGRMLIVATGLGSCVLAVALWRLQPGWMAAGLVTTMGAKLWFLDRMVWLHADAGRPALEPEVEPV